MILLRIITVLFTLVVDLDPTHNNDDLCSVLQRFIRRYGEEKGACHPFCNKGRRERGGHGESSV